MSMWTGSDLGAPRPGDRQTLALERIAAALEALMPLVRGLGDQLARLIALHDAATSLEVIGEEMREPSLTERHQYLLLRRGSTQRIALDLERSYLESPSDDYSLAAAVAHARMAAAEATDALLAFEAAHTESRETR